MTERTLRIQADHVLHGYEAVAMRLMQTVSAATTSTRVARPLANRLARDAEALPETDRQLRRRFPDEPYRQRFGFIAERLRRTRVTLADDTGPRSGHYEDCRGPRRGAGRAPGRARRRWPGARRLGRGRGAALAGRDVRVPPRVARDPPARRGPSGGARTRSTEGPGPVDADGSVEVAPGVTLDEVLATFRSIVALQERFGEEACRRFVVSFTAEARDVTDVLRLARIALERGGRPGRRDGGRGRPAPRRRAAVRIVRRARARPARSSTSCCATRAIEPTSRPAATARR